MPPYPTYWQTDDEETIETALYHLDMMQKYAQCKRMCKTKTEYTWRCATNFAPRHFHSYAQVATRPIAGKCTQELNGVLHCIQATNISKDYFPCNQLLYNANLCIKKWQYFNEISKCN